MRVSKSILPANRRRSRRPHTPEWFRALAAVDPLQAAMTTAATERTGRLHVCSVCGDRPAPVYDTLEPPFLPVRLCADCAAIQTGGFGLRVRLRQPGT